MFTTYVQTFEGLLTMWNLPVQKKAPVDIHGKVNHVCFTKKIQLSMK